MFEGILIIILSIEWLAKANEVDVVALYTKNKKIKIKL